MYDQYSIRHAFFQGNITEVFLFERPAGAGRPVCRRLDADTYLNFSTGEICEYEKSVDKSPAGVRRTVTAMRRLINANFTGAANELFVTLTYKENMTDTKQLYTDMDKFMKRLRYSYPSSDFLWIMAVEPQERGAWHCHILLRDLAHEHLFVSNKVMAGLWGLGFTKTVRLTDNSNVGAYLSAYLLNTSGKKGARLGLYPKNMRMYRHSRNCVQPEARYITREELRRLLASGVITWSKEYDIKDDEGNVVNRLRRLQFVNHSRP